MIPRAPLGNIAGTSTSTNEAGATWVETAALQNHCTAATTPDLSKIKHATHRYIAMVTIYLKSIYPTDDSSTVEHQGVHEW
jgi:hypothetical protein